MSLSAFAGPRPLTPRYRGAMQTSVTSVWRAALALWAGGIVALGGCAPDSGGERASEGARPGRVWVIRHAEKDTTPGAADPGLTDAGRARAAEWASRFKAEALTAVYCTKWRRSRETAEPIAAAHALTVTTLPESPARPGLTGKAAADQRLLDDAAALAADIRAKHASGRVVVVGHSNTIPMILDALGAGAPGLTIADSEYAGVWEVVLTPAR